MRKDNRVEEDDLAGNHNVTTKDGDGGIQLSIGVEQGIVLHFGEGFVRVGIVRSPLDSSPGPHSGVPSNHAVEDQRVFPQLGVACRFLP